MKIGLLEYANFPPTALNKLKKLGEVILLPNKNPASHAHDLDVLFVRLNHFIGKAFFHSAPRLKYICTPTTGLNHIDVSAASDRKITILSLKGEYDFLAGIHATPEHIFGLTIALLRNYAMAFLNGRNRRWDRNRYIGSELNGCSVGIIGMGRVGRIITSYFTAFESRVRFFDTDGTIIVPNAERCSTLEDLIDASTVIVLAASFARENDRMLCKRHFLKMKDKYFINAARGELIDEKALMALLKNDHFKGVALDVVRNETRKNNLGLILRSATGKNIIITPHIGGATWQSMSRTTEFITDKLLDRLATGV